MQNDRNYVALWLGVVAVIAVLYCSPARADARVILLRGWFGVFSAGLDEIADALKAKGIRAEVAGHLYWRTATDDIQHERVRFSQRHCLKARDLTPECRPTTTRAA